MICKLAELAQSPTTSHKELILLHRVCSEIMANIFQLADNSPTPTQQSLAGMRFGLCRTPDWSAAEPSTVNALNLGAGRRPAKPSRRFGTLVLMNCLSSSSAPKARRHRR